MARLKLTTAVILTLGIGIASLTGCSISSAPAESASAVPSASAPSADSSEDSGGAAGEQTVAEACAQANASFASLQTELASVSAEAAAGNYSAVYTALTALHETYQSTAAAVTNPEVGALLTTMTEQVGAFAALFSGLADGDLASLGAKAQEISTISQQIAETGQSLITLCAA